MSNKEAIAKTLSLIVNNQDKWEQENWINEEFLADFAQKSEEKELAVVQLDNLLEAEESICGTSACIAGWASLVGGYKIVVDARDLGEDYLGPLEFSLMHKDADARAMSSGFQLSFQEVGREVLGLSEECAEEIFMEMDHRVALARLYSVYKTDDTLLEKTYEQEFKKAPPADSPYNDSDFGFRPRTEENVAVVDALYSRCVEEFKKEKTNA